MYICVGIVYLCVYKGIYIYVLLCKVFEVKFLWNGLVVIYYGFWDNDFFYWFGIF